jgi:hypothetical protein
MGEGDWVIRAFVLLLFLSCLPGGSNAQEAVDIWSWNEAEDLVEIPEVVQSWIVVSMVEGMQFGKDEWLRYCVEGKSPQQLRAVVMKYINENPERWHNPAIIEVRTALKRACPFGE